jgi:hypothetical protein
VIAGMTLSRRELLGAAMAGLIPGAQDGPVFRVDHQKLQGVYDAALTGARGNTRQVNGFADQVLIEGGVYPGAWLECAPQEGLVYAPWNTPVAVANQRIFFAFQRADGQLPCWVWFKQVGYGQIQMVVPIAATAFELYQRTNDARLLDEAYGACSRWDAWLTKYRNTRGTGLCELFCEYDTGHDNSPRVKGLSKDCPGAEAKNLPPGNALPWLAPDLSATVYGGRVALAKMASALGKGNESARWLESAERIRGLILGRLYDSKDSCFYDLNAENRFVRVRGDALTRVAGEHVPDRKLFGDIWRAQLGNPNAFWTKYPFPSIAVNDAAFVRPILQNSWGGPSQALTALRAPRWMEHYGHHADLTRLMLQWVEAITRTGTFLQQMDPQSGVFTRQGQDYSPAILVLLDFVWRLYGVRETGEELEWNCRLPLGASRVETQLPLRAGTASLVTDAQGSTLTVSGKRVAHVTGQVRLMTSRSGKLLRLVGTEAEVQQIEVQIEDGRRLRRTVQPDEVRDVGKT